MLSDTKRRLRRSKESERKLARWLILHDGLDPRYEGMASSTGRIGHLTGLRQDVASITYDAENKNFKVTSVLWKAWKQICSIAVGHGKTPLLRIEPSNIDHKGVPVMHIISEARHEQLLRNQRRRTRP